MALHLTSGMRSTKELKGLQLAVARGTAGLYVLELAQPGANQMLKLLGPDAVVLPIPRLYTLSFNLVALTVGKPTSGEDNVRVLRFGSSWSKRRPCPNTWTLSTLAPSSGCGLLQSRL